jgi:Methylamine utilisation protein MauE
LSGTLGVAGVLLAQLAAFLALLLIASAAHKAVGWRRTRRVVENFAGVPRPAAAVAAFAACAAEALAGASLVVPELRSTGAWLAAAIFGTYLGLILRAVMQHRGAVDCGCSFGSDPKRLGAFELARNTLLLAAAVLLAAFAHAVSPIAPSQVLAAGALLALYGALDQVMAIQPMRRGTVL